MSKLHITYLLIPVLTISFLCGCSRGKGVIIDRPQKEQISRGIGGEYLYEPILTPNHQRLDYNNLTIEVTYTSKKVLDEFFSNEKVFGKFAMTSPYPDELIVFYVKISNMSGKTIFVEPRKFVLLDDFFTQYEHLSPDYISGLYENKGSAFSFAKTTASAAPGIYGSGIGALTTIASSFSWKKYYLIKRVALNSGYVHNKVIYDGYIAFLKPHKSANALTLVLPNIKYDFNANEEPQDSMEFRFNFQTKHN